MKKDQILRFALVAMLIMGFTLPGTTNEVLKAISGVIFFISACVFVLAE